MFLASKFAVPASFFALLASKFVFKASKSDFLASNIAALASTFAMLASKFALNSRVHVLVFPFTYSISCTFADNGQCFFPLLLRYFRYFRDASFDWACGTTCVASSTKRFFSSCLLEKFFAKVYCFHAFF